MPWAPGTRETTTEAAHRDRGLRARLLHALEIEDHTRSFVRAAGSDHHELRAPCGFPVAFEVQGGVGFVAERDDFTRLLVDACLSRFGSEQGCHHLAVRMEEPIETGMSPRPTRSHIQQSGRERLFGRDRAVEVPDRR